MYYARYGNSVSIILIITKLSKHFHIERLLIYKFIVLCKKSKIVINNNILAKTDNSRINTGTLFIWGFKKDYVINFGSAQQVYVLTYPAIEVEFRIV